MDLSEPLVQTSSPNASLLEHDFNHVQGEESPRREVHGDDFEHQPPSMENSILSTGSNDQVSLENFLVPQISFPGLPNQVQKLCFIYFITQHDFLSFLFAPLNQPDRPFGAS